MTLRSKTLTIIGLAFAGLVAALYVGFRNTVLDDFERLENKKVRLDTAQLVMLFRRELRDLDDLATDWASWDDAASFAQGASPGFASAKLVPQTFSELRINLVTIVDRAGKVKAAKTYDYRGKADLETPTRVIERAVALARGDGATGFTMLGVLLTGHDPILLAARPIREQAADAPVLGVVVIGRYLDTAAFTDWRDVTGLTLSAERLDGKAAPLPDDYRMAYSHMSPNDQLAVVAYSPEHIAGFTILSDLDGRPALMLRAVQDRDIHVEAERVTRYLGFVVLVCVLFSALTAVALLERTVLSRLARLNADVAQIGSSGDFSARTQVAGSDELSELAEAINGMLDAVQRSQRQRLDSEVRYRAVVTQTSEGLLVGDIETKGIVEANPAILQLLGYDPVDVPALTIYSVWGAAPEEVDAFLQRVTTAGELVEEVDLRRKDGGTLNAEIHANCITYGGRDSICAVVRDLTARREAEDERRRFEQQMLHAQKLESLGVLAGGIAHDFNNLLTGMLGNTALALRTLPPHAAERPYLERIETTTNRAAELVAQMLAYAGKGKFRIESLDMGELVREMADLVRVSISKLATLHINCQDHIAPIRGDATQLRQVVMNLITNASDALDSGAGTIRVTTSMRRLDTDELASMQLPDRLPSGRYACLTVEDSGSGMDPATVARIFDPFFTTKFTGRGLGLAAVLGIVRGHHGAIQVNSQRGHGTTFEVFLPVEELAVEPATVAESPWDEVAGAWGRGLTVLVVDDEPDVASVGAAILEHAGLRAVIARDGFEALALFNGHGDGAKIDAVLLDLTMPGMSGIEVLYALHKSHPGLPVVLTSGYPQPVMADGREIEGLSGFVQKPYHPSALLGSLKQAIGGRSELV